MSAVHGRTALLPGVDFEFRTVGALFARSLAPRAIIRCGGHRFEFALVRFRDGRCRAYILSQPGYGSRSASLGRSHRLEDFWGRTYVCWAPEPRNPNAMAAAIALWVAGTCRYLETGSFPDAATAQRHLARR